MIARASGPELDGIIHDLMALNARPHMTGGLFFGVMSDNIVTGSMIVAAPYVEPRVLSDAIEAVVETTDVWRTLIENSGQNARSAAASEDAGPVSSDPGPNTSFV